MRGERAFLVAATAPGERRGRMGVIERVRSVDYDEAGAIRRIVFDGWEGRTTGARHLVERVWNRTGRGGGGTDTRGGFDRIEILELRRPAPRARPERPLHPHARPSVHDARDEPEAPDFVPQALFRRSR